MGRAAADGTRTPPGTRGARDGVARDDLGKDKLYGHIKPKKNRTRLPEFCRSLRSLYPPETRIAIVLDNLSRAA